jgi:ion channel-forming bestrophin family protein
VCIPPSTQVRFLWIWLTLLPFALTRTFNDFGTNTWWEDKPQPVLVLAMLFIGFIFLSIEDIAVQIEEPFAILPLQLHQKWLVWDAEQTKQLARLSLREDAPASDAAPKRSRKWNSQQQM